ncbi:transcriptional regulator, GntR family [Rubritalea squalenifaciens DSM 18772]|uniref:Transcriptional regulator, GntR family n=1 Tax=Rubritalea squalenifaciens DSM 18772 TaxID=1123071 RepID=A0A1M6L6H6_9BACT|nr:PLP-dependent aminotransferase family protein [Rubritalea squalenifaciens]SHJ66780.1 transcriptional regulator, GntR family [Rubritalea squalenifaciens DSM 18772]
MKAANEKTAYLELADDLQQLIQSGSLRVGDRMPSIRQLAHDKHVSITTIQSAYEVLENRGFVEARPRSGYYVRPRVPASNRLPAQPESSRKLSTVERPDLFDEVFAAVNNPDIVPLGCAVPYDGFYPTAKLASLSNKAFRDHGASALRYSLSPGRIELRKQVSKRMLRSGATVSPDEIIITSGATEAITIALSTCCKPGDLVAVEAPTFFGILRIIESLRLKVIEIPVCPINGIDIDVLDEISDKHPIKACVVQPNFQNPTSSVIPHESRNRLVKLAQQRDFTLIEDDLYGDLTFDNDRPTSLLAHAGGENVIHCGGVSKTLSPGLRVGWLAARSGHAEMTAIKNISFTSNPTVSELVVASFLADGGYDRHLRRIRQRYQSQVLQMRESIFKNFPEGTRVNSPRGSFVLWVQLPLQVDCERVAHEAMSRGISITPGSIYSASKSLTNYLRINGGYPMDERIRQAIRTVGKLCQQQLYEKA